MGSGTEPQMRHTLNATLILLTWILSTHADDVDPAPPRVNTLPVATAPGPKDYDRVTFHGVPKPLPAGAVTHDWKWFLGPTHNGVSTETKLLKKWAGRRTEACLGAEQGNCLHVAVDSGRLPGVFAPG